MKRIPFDFQRRRLLGATIVSPLMYSIGKSLVGEAYAQPAMRNVFVTFVTGGMFNQIPGDKDGMNPGGYTNGQVMALRELPGMFGAFGKFKDRAILCEGMINGSGPDTIEWQHFSGHGALACSLAPKAAGQNVPNQATFDQYVADRIGKDTPVKSILLGEYDAKGTPKRGTFASGPSSSLPQMTSPETVFEALFSKAPPPTAAGQPAGISRTVVFDALRTDIKELQKVLAGTELKKMDDYLAVIDRTTQQGERRVSLKCDAPGKGMGGLDEMMQLSALAVRCGVSNVLGIAVGNGLGHDNSGIDGGHTDAYVHNATAYMKSWSTKLAGMIDIIAGGQSATGKSLIEDTTFLFLSDVGGTTAWHHSDKLQGTSGAKNYHAFALGNRKMKTNIWYKKSGAFIGNFYNTLGASMGAPGFQGHPSFGKTDAWPELMG